MEIVNIISELQEIFRDIFDDNSIVLKDSTSSDDIKDWDSLSHVRLVVAVEKHFKIKFAFSELKNLKNVGDMSKLIASKLEAKQQNS